MQFPREVVLLSYWIFISIRNSMRKRIIASAYGMQDFGLGVNSKHGGVHKNIISFVTIVPWRGRAFAGCSGGYTYRAQ